MKVEPLLYGDRKVYTVASFNRGVADWLQRLPTLWIEGEVTELGGQTAGAASSSRSRIRPTARACPRRFRGGRSMR